MKRGWISAAVCFFACAAFAQQHHPLADSTQALVVTTADWNAVPGTLQRFERSDVHAKWKAVGAPISIVVGKSGLGWGTGLTPTNAAGTGDPIKKEGDGKAPAGVFPLLTSFGYAPQAPPQWKMPYMSLTDSIQCVDDVHSKFYNQVLDRATVTPDWNSDEQMHRPDDLYRWGLVVGNNSSPVVAGDGSCVFMHIWRGPGTSTVGCTAMPQQQIESLLGWLDPRKKPLLVQMPVAQYEKFRKRWQLPKLTRQ